MTPEQREAAMAHYEELARLGKAIASPARLRLIDLLRQGPRSVEVLAEQAGLSVANVSQHLQQLRAAHLVDGDKDGQRVVYRLASKDVGHLFVCLRLLGESVLPELDRLKTTLQVHDADKRNELLQRITRGEVTVLDVRSVDEWHGGHLLDAVNIPLAELPARLSELPKKRDVVAYCRGPYCPMALSAVEILRDAGYRAEHFDLGPADLAGTNVAKPTSRLRARVVSTVEARVSTRTATSPRAKSRKRSPA